MLPEQTRSNAARLARSVRAGERARAQEPPPSPNNREREAMARGLGRFLLAACVASALLPSGAKKAKKRKPSFIETAAKREKYIDYLFERYDGDGDKALGEEEVDTANDEEPLFRVHHKYDDTLNTVSARQRLQPTMPIQPPRCRWPTRRPRQPVPDQRHRDQVFDLDRLDTDKSRKVTRHELMPALAELEGLRQKQLEDWCANRSPARARPRCRLTPPCSCHHLTLFSPLYRFHHNHRGSEASNKAQLLKDIEDFHECTDEPENEHFGYEFGKRYARTPSFWGVL